MNNIIEDEARILFAYGSLTSEDEVKRLLGGLRKSIIAKLYGFRRECCVRSGNDGYGFLGVVKDKNCFINGVILFLNERDILCLDNEEGLYHREDINTGDVVFYKHEDEKISDRIMGLTVQIYVPNKNNFCESIKLLQSYEKLVYNSFSARGKGFYDDFLKTTKFS